jgi:DNA polymerase III delta prime subunit
MRRFLVFPLALCLFAIWYAVNPFFWPSRLPLRYSDGSIVTPGAVQWLVWFFDRSSQGTAFRNFIFKFHPGLAIHYMVAFLVSHAIPGIFLGYQRAKYTEKIRSGVPVLSWTFWTRLSFWLKGKRASGVLFTPVQRVQKNVESKHLLLLGGSGSGKTQTIVSLLQDIFNRRPEDKVIVFDVKGDYTSWFCDPDKSVFLSPGDGRTPEWCIGRDIQKNAMDPVLNALILEDGTQDPVWPLSAKAALRAVLTWLLEKDLAFTLSDLQAALNPETIRLAVQKYDSNLYDTLKDEASEMSRSVLFTLNSMVQGVGNLSGPNSKFSVKDFLLWSKKTRLFLKRPPGGEDGFSLSARLLVACVLAHVMSLPDDPNRRIWLILDELAILRSFPLVLEAVERGRSKGLCVVAGVQDWGSMEKYYDKTARSLYTSFASKVFLAMKDPDSAEYYSKGMGEILVDRVNVTPNRDSVFSLKPAITTQIVTEKRPVVSASDLLNIPPPSNVIHGYSQIEGYPLSKIAFRINPTQSVWPVFVESHEKKKDSSGTRKTTTDKKTVFAKHTNNKEEKIQEPEVKKEEQTEDVQKDLKDYTKMTVTERFHPGHESGTKHGEGLEEVVKEAGKLAATILGGIPPVLDITEEAMTLTKEEVRKMEKEKSIHKK